MRDRGHKVVFKTVKTFELVVGGAQFSSGLFQRARFFFQLLRVHTQTSGLLQDIHHVV